MQRLRFRAFVRPGVISRNKQTQASLSRLSGTERGGPAVAKAIIAHNFDEADLDRISSIVREIGAGKIYDDGDADRLQHEIILVDVRNPSLTDNCPGAKNTWDATFVSASETRDANRQPAGLVAGTKNRTDLSTGTH